MLSAKCLREAFSVANVPCDVRSTGNAVESGVGVEDGGYKPGAEVAPVWWGDQHTTVWIAQPRRSCNEW